MADMFYIPKNHPAAENVQYRGTEMIHVRTDPDTYEDHYQPREMYSLGGWEAYDMGDRWYVYLKPEVLDAILPYTANDVDPPDPPDEEVVVKVPEWATGAAFVAVPLAELQDHLDVGATRVV